MTTTHADHTTRLGPMTPDATTNPWLLWRPEGPAERHLLTVADMAECRCPDLCDRDHANE